MESTPKSQLQDKERLGSSNYPENDGNVAPGSVPLTSEDAASDTMCPDRDGVHLEPDKDPVSTKDTLPKDNFWVLLASFPSVVLLSSFISLFPVMYVNMVLTFNVSMAAVGVMSGLQATSMSVFGEFGSFYILIPAIELHTSFSNLSEKMNE